MMILPKLPVATLLTLGSLAIVSALPAHAFETVSEVWIERWRADLEFARTEFPEAHANLFHEMSREEFESQVSDLSVRIPQLSHQEIVMELARIVALVQDGHSRITLPMAPGSNFFQGHSRTPEPEIPGLVFRTYPIRLYLYSDGVYVREIAAQNSQYAGARVVGIGTLSVEEAMAAVEPVIHRDNDMQVKDLMPSRLVVPEVLAARGVVDDPEAAQFKLETMDGEQVTLRLRPTEPGESIEWADARPSEDPVPLYLQNHEDNYWFEYLPTKRAVYLQYNWIENKEDENITQFCKRLEEFIEDQDVDKLVIDLRWNHGGDNSNNRALIRALTRSDKINQSGHLFTIVGRSTFSAAMMLAVDLEKWTQTLFVGEPTGSSPIHYGDSRKLRLPNSGITVRLSTLFWQYSRPGDQRPWIAPHLPAQLSSTDYRENRDPVLETILSSPSSGRTEEKLDGSWEGAMTILGDRQILKFQFLGSARGWTGTLEIPKLTSETMDLENISLNENQLHCELPVRDGILTLSAVRDKLRWYGTGERKGIEIPFVLWKTE